jgi:probable rRNA maturation factor
MKRAAARPPTPTTKAVRAEKPLKPRQPQPLQISGQRLLPKALRALCLRRARAVVRAVGLPDGVIVGLMLTHDLEMRALNRHHRGIDKTTDVLSFSAWEGVAIAGSEDELGDLVISVDQARRQAKRCGHGLDVEIAVLVAHGLLHLLGLDHERGDDDSRHQAEVEMGLLSRAGVDPAAALIARVV